MKYFSLFVLAFALVGAGCGSADSTDSTTTSTDAVAGTALAGSDDANRSDTPDVVDSLPPEDDLEQGVSIAPAEDAEAEDIDVEENENAEVDELVEVEVTSGAYMDYDADVVTTAAENGSAVLFFHASWCPTCKTLNDDIEASIANIPEGVTIFRTDYDSATDLRQQYAVTYQHTLVQVDADGSMINKWSGGSTLESVLENIQ